MLEPCIFPSPGSPPLPLLSSPSPFPPPPQLFPLFCVLLAVLWLATSFFSDYFHSISILTVELQVLTLLGSMDLTYPSWVQALIQLCSVSLFAPVSEGVSDSE